MEEYTGLSYKTITKNNVSEMTESLFKEIVDCNARSSREMEKSHFKESYNTHMQEIKAKNRVMLLAFKKNKLVGFVNGILKPNKSFFISNIAVHRESQKEGIGFKLKARLLAELRSNYGIKKIQGNALPTVRRINRRLVGDIPLKDGVIRKNKSKFIKYELKDIIGPHTITIKNKNPKKKFLLRCLEDNYNLTPIKFPLSYLLSPL